MAIVDGRQWRRERQQHLQAALDGDGDLTDEQRAAIQAELSKLDAEVRHDRRHWWRWFLFGSRPPGQ